MPQPALTVVNLIASFTAELERIIDAQVATRLEEAFSQLRDHFAAPVPALPTRSLSRTRAVQQARPVPPSLVHPSPPQAPAAHQLVRRRLATPRPPAPTLELPKPKTATVIPADVKITRLPPGPVPGARRSYSELRSACRVPGCPERHSGPRYDLVCRDHFAKLNAEERQKYKAMWKAAHAAA